jgi:sterol desaturase/sphingolipid hydroxylase (fatty acid hydroxylase superfamily)
VLPEDHDGHHRNPEIEFGDIFRFYDAPARAMIAQLRAWTPKRKRVPPVRRAAVKRRTVAKQTS